MSAQFEVREVVLRGNDDGLEWRWRFTAGVNVVVGPIGVGKTSLLELIKYAFGGDGTLTRKIREVGRDVILRVAIDDRIIFLRREIQSGSVDVASNDQGSLGSYPVDARGGRTTISDYLMTALELPMLTVTRSVANPVDEFTRISFHDVYSYMYLDQEEIDRSTIHHKDSARNAKRLQTFRMLYRLLDSATAEIEVQLRRTEGHERRLRQRIAVIRDFLASVDADEPGRVAAEATDLEQRQTALAVEISGLAARARAATSMGSSERRQAVELEQRLQGVKRELATATVEVKGLRAVRAQLVLDRDRTIKALAAGQVFSAFRYVDCPGCLEALPDRDPGVCAVCGEAHLPKVERVALAEEQRRTEEQLAETEQLVARAEAERKRLEEADVFVQKELGGVERAIDERVRDSVAPYIDELGRLRQREGELRAAAEAARFRRRQHAEVQRLTDDADQAKVRSRGLQEELEQARADDEVARERVDELSKIFSEILTDMKLPWVERAAVDPATYLPRIDGGSLESLGSGGMKAVVNTSYFLANLIWSVRNHPTSLLPRFMVIDSPRKDHGAGDKDLAQAERIYTWLRNLSGDRQRAFMRARGFQVIIADNDLPASAAGSAANVIRLDYDTPLIRDPDEE